MWTPAGRSRFTSCARDLSLVGFVCWFVVEVVAEVVDVEVVEGRRGSDLLGVRLGLMRPRLSRPLFPTGRLPAIERPIARCAAGTRIWFALCCVEFLLLFCR